MKTGIVLFISCLLTLWIFHEKKLDDRLVSGCVTEQAANMPLAGAMVVVKGTPIRTTTDSTGYFTLRVPENHHYLIVSFRGYQDQEVFIAYDTILEIQMAVSPIENERISLHHETQHTLSIESFPANPQIQSGSGLFFRSSAEDGVNWNTEDYDLINENRFFTAGIKRVDQTCLAWCINWINSRELLKFWIRNHPEIQP